MWRAGAVWIARALEVQGRVVSLSPQVHPGVHRYRDTQGWGGQAGGCGLQALPESQGQLSDWLWACESQSCFLCGNISEATAP